jgi:syntaxin 18
MMEKRILREVEKNRSVLANARPGTMPEFGGFDDAPVPPLKYKGSSSAHLETQALQPEEELSPEQIQMFEKQNQDMLKHYESTLDQVRYVGFMTYGSVDILINA